MNRGKSAKLFQSTLPCGSDSGTLSLFFHRSFISIHAPLRERRLAAVHRDEAGIFQSTLPCGSDLPARIHHRQHCKFQSTLPCGSDAGMIGISCSPADFNPRSLAGATNRATYINSSYFNFNPRSLAGATKTMLLPSSAIRFQSTLPCGSDRRSPSMLPPRS